MPAYTYQHGDRPLEGVTIQRAVGRGGFGEVYYALSDGGKQLAVKYLRDNPDIELRGINTVMNLKSPHLITVYDVRHNADGEAFVIMEYVGGPSLREVMIAEPSGMAPEKAVFFVSGIARGLTHLHERGVVHRDLKPANIFYDDGYVKIGDYGLSKHISISRHSNQTVSVGTVHYMAPEIGSGNYSAAIDIYSLGVILYEMMTGRLPFHGASMAEILMRHLSDTPDLGGVPEPFRPIIAKSLEKDPEQRWASADAMVDALHQISDIPQRLTSFNPASISSTPRSAEAPGDAPTRTSPPPPPIPDLDARGAGPRRQELGNRLRNVADRVEGAVTRMVDRTAELTDRIGRPRSPASKRADFVTHTRNAAQRLLQIIVLAMITVGVAFGLMFVSDREPVTVFVLAWYMLGGAFGASIGAWAAATLLDTRHWFFERAATAGVAAAMMSPAVILAEEQLGDEAVMAGLALCASLLICDFVRRVRHGRQGRIDGDEAWTPAITAFVLALVLGAEDFLLATAGCGAMLALLTPAIAKPLLGGLPAPGARRQSTEPAVEPDHEPSAERIARTVAATAPTPAPPSVPTTPAAANPAPASTAPTARMTDAPPYAPQRRRRGGGWLAFFGLVFLTAAGVGAWRVAVSEVRGQQAMNRTVHIDVDHYHEHTDAKAYREHSQDATTSSRRQVVFVSSGGWSAPAALLLLVGVAGSVLLIIGRRYALWRTLGGLTLVWAAALIAIGPQADTTHDLVRNGVQALTPPLVFLGLMAIAGLWLLVKRPPNRNRIVL